MGEREFRAFARPQGYGDLGLKGVLIEVQERPAHGTPKLRVLTRAEAAQLHAELGAALRTLMVGQAMADPERPRAYTGPYPIRGPSLAEVDVEAEGRAA
ncbi:hypothetical protein ACLBKU_11930 [Erythrobacter sp. NE805]|uniref:hypothetical protein n=1 Tax=Erythrobacter sp. NE805 TaxID=3389875 RepID=UPI00396B0AC0